MWWNRGWISGTAFGLPFIFGFAEWDGSVGGGAGVLARVLLYLIGNGGIYVQVLSGRSADELGMVFILCYQPLYHRLIQCYTMEIRMGREWVR